VKDLYVCGLRTQRVDGCAGTGVLPPALGQHRPLATADDCLLAFSRPNYAQGIRQANEGE
jgi:hypothetical protein